MLLQRATLDPNLWAFGQTTGDGAGSIPAAVRRGIRGRYENKCAFCGEAEYSDAELDSRVQPKLSCAHLAPRAGYFHTGFANKFDVNSMRNFILLCGSHGRKGTCHDGFDSHKLALIPDILGQAQGWKLLNAYSEWKAGDQGNSGLQLRTVTFDKFDPGMVYKRALATRLHKFVLENRRALREVPDVADMIGAVRDLSMTESCRGQRETEAAVEFPSSEFSQAQASQPVKQCVVVPPRAGRGVLVPPRTFQQSRTPFLFDKRQVAVTRL